MLAAHLIQEPTPGRYGFHDLLRLYARELADGETEAAQRLYRWYLHRADGAARLLYPAMLRLPFTPAEPAPFTDPDTAMTWLDDEIANISAAVAAGTAPELRRTARLLADAVRGYFRRSMKTTLWESTARAAIVLAEGDAYAMTSAYSSLSGVHLKRNDQEAAAKAAAEALGHARMAGWPEGEAGMSVALAMAKFNLGFLAEARELFLRTLRLGTELGVDRMNASTLVNLVNVAMLAGDLDEAERRCQEAIRLCDDIGERYLGAMAQGTMSELLCGKGQLAEARKHNLAALTYFREIRDIASEAESLAHLAEIEQAEGNLADASAVVEIALELAVRSGERTTEIYTLNALGVIAGLMGDRARSRDAHRRALDLARRGKATHPEAVALLGLGDPESVREALEIARTSGYKLLERQALDALAH